MFTISVCMIVKNEEETLDRVLSCAKQFADEIVIVDTGSTDNSKKIAKKYTDKIFDFKWVDDFSKARNFSFSKATCDYQMWLDADDFIPECEIEKIIKLKKSSNLPDVFMCRYTTGKDLSLSYFRERLLKRSSNFVWQGFVHEAIPPHGEIQYTDIEIQHKKVKTGNPKRNLKLYQQALKSGITFGGREQYYYSRELYYNNYISSAIKNFKKYLKMDEVYPPDNLCAHLMLCDCFLLKNENDKALNVLFMALKKHLPTAELCCKIGKCFNNLSDIDKAIHWYKSALICQPQTQGFVLKDYSDIIPFLELSRLLFSKGEFEEATYFHKLAKSLYPNHPSVVYNQQFFN